MRGSSRSGSMLADGDVGHFAALVEQDMEVIEVHADKDPDLMAAARVSLGSLGLITQVTLRVVPAFNLARHVWLQPIDSLLNEAPKLAAQHRHFEFYVLPHTGYAAAIRHDVYTGQDLMLPKPGDEDVLGDLKKLRDWLGRFPKLRRWAAQQAIDANMTEDARHRSFRLLSSVRPTRFNETEWHLPRDRALACLREVVAKLESRNEVFFPLEFRFIRRDEETVAVISGGGLKTIEAVQDRVAEPLRVTPNAAAFDEALRQRQGVLAGAGA